MNDTIDPRDTPEFALEYGRPAQPEDPLTEARSHAAQALEDYDALWEGDHHDDLTQAADRLSVATRRLLEASATPLGLAREATRIKPGDYVAVIYDRDIHMSAAAHDNILKGLTARWPGTRIAILAGGPRLEIMEPTRSGDPFARAFDDGSPTPPSTADPSH